jgi:hypothetical protein
MKSDEHHLVRLADKPLRGLFCFKPCIAELKYDLVLPNFGIGFRLTATDSLWPLLDMMEFSISRRGFFSKKDQKSRL